MKKQTLTMTLALMLFLSVSFVVALKPGESTIVEVVLMDDGEFDVLQEAVIQAELVDALNGKGQYTVFAPTDQAFIDTLGVANESEAISVIQSLPKEDLTNILLYHVVEGRRKAKSVVAAPEYETLGGEILTRDEVLPKLVDTDYSAKNGIIHIINEVLLP